MKTIKIMILSLVWILIGWFSLAQRWWTIGISWTSLPWTEDITSGSQTTAASDWLVVDVIQRAINRLLGILAFIALLILLYAGFLMLTAAGDDEKYNKWFTILKQVALWLAFIGLAWLVVSMIFYLINWVTTGTW
jgi:hypothetical protein